MLSTLVKVETKASQIELTLDLSNASLFGGALIRLSGSDILNAPLVEVIFDETLGLGLKSTNDSKTCFAIKGSLYITSYETPDPIDPTGYVELAHLPNWTDEISAIADKDQLQAQLDGYALKVGTESVTSNATANAYVYDPVAKKGRKEQGMAFHGSLAFDLKNRLGTGEMTFLDLKEKYVNDHTLKLDLTGEEGENDTDENDMAGTGNHNALFFEYASKNVTATKGTTTFNNENRSDPSNGAMKGRLSVHSLNGILDVIMELTDSTDPRFQRLTSLVASLSAETLLTKVLDGQYFELLTSKILTSVDVQGSSTTVVVAPGIIQQHSGLTLKIG